MLFAVRSLKVRRFDCCCAAENDFGGTQPVRISTASGTKRVRFFLGPGNSGPESRNWNYCWQGNLSEKMVHSLLSPGGKNFGLYLNHPIAAIRGKPCDKMTKMTEL